MNGDHRLPRVVRNRKIRCAFLVFGACGVAGVLVDLDHPLAWALGETPDRFLHTPLFVVVCFIVSYTLAYLGRLYGKLVLKRGEE